MNNDSQSYLFLLELSKATQLYHGLSKRDLYKHYFKLMRQDKKRAKYT